MAEKPSESEPDDGRPEPLVNSEQAGPHARSAEFELMLRSTDRIRVLVQRSCRCYAPQGLRVKIQRTLVLFASGEERPKL